MLMHICIKIPLAMITTDSILSIAVTLTILFSAYHPFSNAIVTDLPFLDLGDETRVHGDGKIFGVPDVSKLLNETELPSYLPFPFGDGNETKIYISYDGLISFGTPYTNPSSLSFPIRGKVVAPYWFGVPLLHNGLILYAVLIQGQESRLNNSQNIFDTVNGYITDNVFKNCTQIFRAQWILAVRWINVCKYMYNCTKAHSSTFQAVLATDGIRSYAIYTYKCGELNEKVPEWLHVSSTIGFSASLENFAEHPLSRTSDVNKIACITSTIWSNIVYPLHKTVTFGPPQFISDLKLTAHQVNVSFAPGSCIPTLPAGETFLCVFSNEEKGITFNTTLSETMSCNFTSFPPLTSIKLVTRFSLYNSQTDNVSFFKRYTFYNCSQGRSCRSCVETDGNCGWCLYDFTCTNQPKYCSFTDSFIILNRTSSQDYSDVCPVLSRFAPYKYYVKPVNVNSSLIVKGKNFPASTAIQYMCKFYFGISVSVTMARRLSSSRVQCTGQVHVHPFFFSIFHNGYVPLFLQLILKNEFNDSYTLDTSDGRHILTFIYQCSDLAMECYTCTAQRTGIDNFMCGWCGNACVDDTATCSTNFITVFSDCLVISAISPDSGPIEGGTTVTITGTNFQSDHSINITVGSLTCTPIEMITYRQIVCKIVSTGNQTQGRVDVVVRIAGSTQDATAEFRFGQPKVFSVNPSYGPAAGGTIVRVRGEDLNIGNTERTTVSLINTKMKMSKAFCDIMSISANEIICSWSEFTVNISGVILATVNNARIQNNSVTYQYLNNPVYTGLTPQQTIRAGGIKLTFTGQYLDVSQRPRLQFNNEQTNTTMCKQRSSGTTLVCIAPSLSVLNNYTVVMDAALGPVNRIDGDLHLVLVDDPVATQLSENSTTIDLSANGSKIIFIRGQRITNVRKEEIKVMVGRDPCVIQITTDTFITCIAPQRDEPVIETVTVLFGQNINNNVGQIEYSAGPNTAVIAGGVTGGVVLILILILLMFACILYYHLSSISNYKSKIEHAQQPIYTFIPPGHGSGIKVNSNIGYLQSASVSGLPSAEDDHIYDRLSYKETYTESLQNLQQRSDEVFEDNDGYYVNDDLFPEESRTTGRVEEMTNKAATNEEMKDDDGYYVNDDLFPAEYKTGNTFDQEDKVTTMKANNGEVNDLVRQEEN